MTGWRGHLDGAALKAEALAERLAAKWRPNDGEPLIEPYRGLADARGATLRGRVLAGMRRVVPQPGQSRLSNARQMLDMFLTREVPGAVVTVPGTDLTAEADDEGYFELSLQGVAVAPGWSAVEVALEGKPESRIDCPVFRTRSDATVGVISDVDDTVLDTGAHSLLRNLWTTFTGSALTRRIFPDAIVLVDHLTDHGRNPVYYVSSSPWNMHALLEAVFDRAALQAGPLFLRDYGMDEGRIIAGPHEVHKSAAIDRILAANPGLPFILMGDTGQHDAEIYLDACRRHGGRIIGVVLRETGRAADETTRQKLAQMRSMGAAVGHGPTLDAAATVLERAGVGPWGRRAP